MELTACLHCCVTIESKGVYYCCVAKETQQCCTIPLVRDRAPMSRRQGNLTRNNILTLPLL
jgi:hypothetical protein